MKNYDEKKYEHGKKITPILQELGSHETNLAHAHKLILSLLPLI
jgi:hypothetical protein